MVSVSDNDGLYSNLELVEEIHLEGSDLNVSMPIDIPLLLSNEFVLTCG